MPDELKVLLNQRDLLQAQLDVLLEAVGPNSSEAQDLRTAYRQARENWNEAVNKTLTPGNNEATNLVIQLEAAQKDIEDSCENLAGAADTIGKITAAVNVASKLVGFFH